MTPRALTVSTLAVLSFVGTWGGRAWLVTREAEAAALLVCMERHALSHDSDGLRESCLLAIRAGTFKASPAEE